MLTINKNINGHSAQCFPNDYAYLQVKPPQQPSQCCSNNAINNYKNIAGSMNYGY